MSKAAYAPCRRALGWAMPLMAATSLVALARAAVADAGQSASPGAAFGHSPQQRRASLGMGAVATAAQLGGGQLEVDSQVTLGAGGRAHSQTDRTSLTWDEAHGMSMLQICGEVPLELWRLGEALFIRYNRGQMRQKTSRDMDADALFDQALGSFGQALAWLAPLAYVDPQAQEYDHKPAWRFRLEVAPSKLGAGAAAHPSPQGAPTTAAAAAAASSPSEAQPAIWRQPLSSREIDGFVVVDQATGVLMHGELNAAAELAHPAAPTAKISARLTHQLRRRAPDPPLVAPPAVQEFRRQLRGKDPIAFYRASLAPAATPQPNRPGQAPASNNASDEAADDEAREESPPP